MITEIKSEMVRTKPIPSDRINDLLELADEMKRCIYLSPKKCKEVHREWAKRIREALEVEDG